MRVIRALGILLVVSLGAYVRGQCIAGSLELDLLSVGSGCSGNLLARCLPSYRIAISSSCTVTVAPLTARATHVPSLWSTYAAGAYTQLSQCPTSAGAAVATSSSPTAAQVRAAIQTALERHVYGADNPLSASSVVWNTGTLTVTTAYDACSLRYGITDIPAVSTLTSLLSEAVKVQCLISGLLLVGSECQLSILTACSSGRYAKLLTALTKACPLCPAGTYSSSGGDCIATSAGRRIQTVGATANGATCSAGTYTPTTGYSECLPCNAGTYQNNTGATSCTTCPTNSYARVPGSTQCLRCVSGIPRCIAGTGCSNDGSTASPGYHLASIAAPGDLSSAACALPSPLSFGSPTLAQRCSLAASPATQLSLYVDQYCGVTMTPVGDAACSDPSNPSYASTIKVRGVYASTTRITTTLAASQSSFLMTLDRLNATALTLRYWPATTAYTAAAAVLAAGTKSCSGTATVQGGRVASVPNEPAACPAGTYDPAGSGDGCRTCPVGAYCPAGATSPTPCPAGTYQPYLGQASASACLACPSPSQFTSDPGADSCTVPAVLACPSGSEPNAAGSACSACPAGEKRNATTEDYCVACPPGFYSPANASACTACPLDQFSPVYSLGEQNATGANKCWYCPSGSVAVTTSGTLGQLGSTDCQSCPPGTVAAFNASAGHATCQACADGYFRPGWSSDLSNTCRQIPAGFKESNRSGVAYARAAVESCGKGEASSWAGSVRTPADPQACSPCGGASHAPRRGMSACQVCPAGTEPAKSDGALPGFDSCVGCNGNTYRPAGSGSATCLTCTAGREAHPSGHRACTACAAGWYNPDSGGGTSLALPGRNESCLPCPVNHYQNRTGQAACLPCPAGFTADGLASTACGPCPLGTYSAAAGANCTAAPRGAYVAATPATTYTLCPKGSFSATQGADSCDICPPGQYAPSTGSSTCLVCGAGRWSAGGAAACTACLPGFYSFAGSSSCSPCKAGTFSSGGGAATCSPCPAGKQCPMLATKTPTHCPRGHYSSQQGARLCTPCLSNSYQNLTGQRGCKPCPRGTTTLGRTGQSVCQAQRRIGRRLMLLWR